MTTASRRISGHTVAVGFRLNVIPRYGFAIGQLKMTPAISHGSAVICLSEF